MKSLDHKRNCDENAIVICCKSVLLPTSTELVSYGGHNTHMACSYWFQLCPYMTQGQRESVNFIRILKWGISSGPHVGKYGTQLSRFWSSLIKMLKEGMILIRLVNISWIYMQSFSKFIDFFHIYIYIQNWENTNFVTFLVLLLQEQFAILELCTIFGHGRMDWG